MAGLQAWPPTAGLAGTSTGSAYLDAATSCETMNGSAVEAVISQLSLQDWTSISACATALKDASQVFLEH